MNNLLPHGAAYWKLIEPIAEAIEIHEGPAVFLEGFRKIPVKNGRLFAAHWCQSEVCNGGFRQFFWNSTGVLAPEALEAFRVMGLKEWAGLLEEGMGFFGNLYPREREKRIALISKQLGGSQKIWDPFNKLDDQFYEWLHVEEKRWERAADAYAMKAQD